jgi:NADH-quinone oxidoreductase subunit N
MLNTINAAHLTLSTAQWHGLMPFIILTVSALVSLLLVTVKFGSNGSKLPLFIFSCLSLLAAGAWNCFFWIHEPMPIFSGMITLDYFSSFFNVLLSASSLLVLLGSYSYLTTAKIHYSEFYPIVQVATLGMMLLAASTELLTMFVSIELMSLTVYVLVALRRNNALSNEASVKYFVMGGVSAAIYLYGTALIYGALSTTKLAQISTILSQADSTASSNPIFVAGVVLLLVGFLFKIAAAPFHMWTPDVYQGAPSNITSYMATALKAAVFAAFVRISVSLLGDQGVALTSNMHTIIHSIIWWLALATMIVGNFVALMQQNIKRLMAYSAIAHTGYLLLGLLAGPKVGYSGVIFYLVAYVVMNIGAFSIISMFAGSDDGDLTLDKISGLAKKHPIAGAGLTVFLLSLGGIPPTAGFVGKYYMFSGALEAGEIWLVLIAVLTSAVSVFYYLRVVVLMYMKEALAEYSFQGSKLAYMAIAACIILVLKFGVFPAQLIHAVKKAALF